MDGAASAATNAASMMTRADHEEPITQQRLPVGLGHRQGVEVRKFFMEEAR
jgi:hypothetical protein